MIEKRFEQVKTVHEIAPIFLKNDNRIEALFTPLALLVQASSRRNFELYPERPTTEQILRLFSLAERHKLSTAHTHCESST